MQYSVYVMPLGYIQILVLQVGFGETYDNRQIDCVFFLSC